MKDGKVRQGEVEYFNKNGFLIVKDLFPACIIDSLQQEIKESKALKNANGAILDRVGEEKSLRYVPKPHTVLPSLQKLINSSVFSISAELLQRSVYLIGMDLHCRAAGTDQPTPPHQDSFLWCFEPGFEHLVTCYVSISGMDADSASLRFIKGSNSFSTLEHKMCSVRGFSSCIEEDSSYLPQEMLKAEHVISLDKGDCVFFHSKTIHYTNQEVRPSNARSSVSIRIGSYDIKYSRERQEKYKEYVASNRQATIAQGLTAAVPEAQHN